MYDELTAVDIKKMQDELDYRIAVLRPKILEEVKLMCCMLSRVTSLQPQSPLLMEFSRQEYWSGLLFSTPGNLPNPGIKPESPALADGFFITSITW